jgi:nucleotide-binding universal stress UspA family protein
MHPVRLLLVAPDSPAPLPPATVADTTSTDRAGALTPPPPGRPDPSAGAHPVPHLPRRQRPWLLVAVDDAPASHDALVWTLQEAARREATVVAVRVSAEDTEDTEDVPAHGPLLAELDARVRAATAEAGVRPQVRTAVLDATVFEAFTGAARGADLVVVGSHGKTLLRPAVARTPVRRFARPA